jgi:hypothetical protein
MVIVILDHYNPILYCIQWHYNANRLLVTTCGTDEYTIMQCLYGFTTISLTINYKICIFNAHIGFQWFNNEIYYNQQGKTVFVLFYKTSSTSPKSSKKYIVLLLY